LIARALEKEWGDKPDCVRVSKEEELIEKLDEQWEVVIVDYIIPGLYWPAAIRLVRKSHPTTPVIAISGALREHLGWQNVASEGADDYVSKSHLELLAKAIDGAIERRHMMLEHEQVFQEVKDQRPPEQKTE
jgi:CheY-like chemotaxis protein